MTDDEFEIEATKAREEVLATAAMGALVGQRVLMVCADRESCLSLARSVNGVITPSGTKVVPTLRKGFEVLLTLGNGSVEFRPTADLITGRMRGMRYDGAYVDPRVLELVVQDWLNAHLTPLIVPRPA